MDSRCAILTEFDLGIQQVLRMVNGRQIAEATGDTERGILGALTAPFFGDNQRVEILFLATLSRFPRDDEREVCQQYLADSQTVSEGLGDLLWALLNSAEFQFNH